MALLPIMLHVLHADPSLGVEATLAPNLALPESVFIASTQRLLIYMVLFYLIK
jgi:hypothetical protein